MQRCEIKLCSCKVDLNITSMVMLVLCFATILGIALMHWNFEYSWFVSAVIVFLFQTGVAVFSGLNMKSIKYHYWALASARAQSSNSEDQPKIAGEEFVESYRHLREHGNSFFILFLEIIVGLAIVDVLIGGPLCFRSFSITTGTANADVYLKSVPFLISCLALWTLPSIAVWGMATQLESTLLNQMKKLRRK